MSVSCWAGLDLTKPQIMGVLNVTPDSFSDGGKFAVRDAALRQAERMIAEGACLIDIGGESTRPGANPVSAQEEQDRILPLVEAQLPARISIDTRNAATMRAAARAGAHIWNDVTALKGDRDSFRTALDLSLPLCLMHMQGQPQTMQANPTYVDVVAEVEAELLDQASALEQAGFARDLICLDMGIGFGKTLAHNLSLLAAMDRFAALPYAHLLGVSRKSYIEKALGQPTPADQRLPGSLATAVLAYQAGCRLFRVHDVAQTHQALEIARQIEAASS